MALPRTQEKKKRKGQLTLQNSKGRRRFENFSHAVGSLGEGRGKSPGLMETETTNITTYEIGRKGKLQIIPTCEMLKTKKDMRRHEV